MQVLIRFFAELCVLRRTPQELPVSPVLLGLTLAVNLGIGLLVALIAGLPFWQGMLQKFTEIVLILAALQLALRLSRHPQRFAQSATALLGAGALLGLLALVPLGLNPGGGAESDLAVLGALLLLVLVVWSLVISGHILRHAFDLNLGQGIAIAIAFEVFAVLTIGLLFG